MFKKNLLRSFIILLFMTFFLGVCYPLAMTSIGQVAFNYKVNGSIVEVDGVKYGSELLGQNFVEDYHLWGRPVSDSQIDTSSFSEGDKRYYFAYPSNVAVDSDEFKKWTEERINYIREHNIEMKDSKIPDELIYSSGSGLDPHISYETALYQVKRIARTNDDFNEEEVKKIIKKCTDKKFLGIFGESLTNVLLVNLYLEKIL